MNSSFALPSRSAHRRVSFFVRLWFPDRWSLYKLNEKTDKLCVFVSLVSTKIPFKGTSKEYIGDDQGVLHECVKKALTSCCQQLRRRKQAEAALRGKADRRKQMSKYIPDVSRSFTQLLHSMKTGVPIDGVAADDAEDDGAAHASLLPPQPSSKKRRVDAAEVEAEAEKHALMVHKLGIQPHEQRSDRQQRSQATAQTARGHRVESLTHGSLVVSPPLSPSSPLPQLLLRPSVRLLRLSHHGGRPSREVARRRGQQGRRAGSHGRLSLGSGRQGRGCRTIGAVLYRRDGSGQYGFAVHACGRLQNHVLVNALSPELHEQLPTFPAPGPHHRLRIARSATHPQQHCIPMSLHTDEHIALFDSVVRGDPSSRARATVTVQPMFFFSLVLLSAVRSWPSTWVVSVRLCVLS